MKFVGFLTIKILKIHKYHFILIEVKKIYVKPKYWQWRIILGG